jgi:uncharacterized protein YqeY
VSLIERIDTDVKTAMKEKNELKVSTLRMLKAAVKNKEIDKKVKTLSDSEVIEAIQKQVKQRKDSIAEFEKAGRTDLVNKEKGEMKVLEQYLPKAMGEDELKAIIKKAIETAGAKTKADIGKVMKEVMPQVAGRADGKTINQLASSLLG